MKNNNTQALQKIIDTEIVLFLIGYILFSTTKSEFLPKEYLPFSGIPVLLNFWILTKHTKVMNALISEGHPKKRSLQRRFYVNVFMDVLLMALIIWEILA